VSALEIPQTQHFPYLPLLSIDEPAQTGLKRLEEKGKLTDFSHIGIGL
jgi:hypothetical protein